MITIENIVTYGWEAAIRGMRNPKNSWDRSDSLWYEDDEYHDICGNSGPAPKEENGTGFDLGDADHKLMATLASGGPVHAKYRRMIIVSADITAPLYWWKEFDTYKVGTVANSCSTMHKIAAKKFTLDDFSHEHLFNRSDLLDLRFSPEENIALSAINVGGQRCYFTPEGHLQSTCDILNRYRELFLETKDKQYWWQMIQLLPSSYNQRRTVMLNYEVLHNIYISRKDHKLDEWRAFCDFIKLLPHSELIIGE
jgi:hypothetical protein